MTRQYIYSMRLVVTAWFAAVTLVFAPIAASQSIAVTFDHAPDVADSTGLSASERNTAILRQLHKAHIKSILFVTGSEADQRRSALIRQWGIEGHKIGNHSTTHPDFNSPEVTLTAFEKELLDGDAAIRLFPGYTRRFRFPYLKEGDTVAKRDGFRAFLDSIGYKPAPVSVDASDWYYNDRLHDRLVKDPKANRGPFRDAYLWHLYDRARYYDGLSRKVLGRSVTHVLLLHHNLINALFLGDVLQMFRDKGWTLVDAETAFDDPVYAARPNVLPAGESILWALAKEKGVAGLRYPGEDEIYEKSILDRLGL